MCDFRKQWLCFPVVYFLVSLLTKGNGYYNECDMLETEQGSRYCNITVGLADSGHIISPGTAELGYYNINVSHSWLIMAENISSEQLYVCPAYLDVYPGDVIVFFGVDEVLPNHNVTTTSSVPETYWGEGLVAREQEGVEELLNLSCSVPETGMLYITFLSTDSYALTGFDFIYFTKSKMPDTPNTNMTVRASDFIQQLSIPEATDQFTVEAAEGERIWFQVIHMNLTSSAEEILHDGECKTNPNRMEISERDCSSDACLLTSLCRNPFNMSPVTLVTERNYAHVRLFCNQESGRECAIINYKVFNSLQDQRYCHPDADTNQTYTVLDQQYNNLSHAFDVNSASEESYIWWLENVNNNVTQIAVTENSLGFSPDCVSERVEIYSGKCVLPENLVTYFCGGIKETYKLTTSPYVTVRFTGRLYAARPQQKRFNLLINAGVRPPEITDNIRDKHDSDMMLTVVLPLMIVAVLACIPAVVKVAKASKHNSAVAPLEQPEQYDADIDDDSDPDTSGTQLDKNERDVPYHQRSKSFVKSSGSIHGVKDIADLKQTLGLPPIPKQPSALSLAPSPSPVPSISSLADQEMLDPGLQPSMTMLGISVENEMLETTPRDPGLQPSMTMLGISVGEDMIETTPSAPALQPSITMLGISVDKNMLETTEQEPSLQPSMTMLGIGVDGDMVETTPSDPGLQPSMTMLDIGIDGEMLETTTQDPGLQPSLSVLGIGVVGDMIETAPSDRALQPSVTMLDKGVDGARLETTAPDPCLQPSMTLLGISVDDNMLEVGTSDPGLQPSMTMLGISEDGNLLEAVPPDPGLQPSMTMLGISVDENMLDLGPQNPGLQPSMTMLGITEDGNMLEAGPPDPGLQPSMTMLGISVDENMLEAGPPDPGLQPSMTMLGISVDENILEAGPQDPGLQPSMTMLGITEEGNMLEAGPPDPGLQPSMTMLGISVDENMLEAGPPDPGLQPSMTMLGISVEENIPETTMPSQDVQPPLSMLGIGFDGNVQEQMVSPADPGLQPSMTMLGIGINQEIQENTAPEPGMAALGAPVTPSQLDDLTGLPMFPVEETKGKKKRRKSSVKGKGEGHGKGKKGQT